MEFRKGQTVVTDHSDDKYKIVDVKKNVHGAKQYKLDKISGWWSGWQLKKATPTKKKPAKKYITQKQALEARAKIYKLRDSLYNKFYGKWSNSYGKDQFDEAIKCLNKAGEEFGYIY